MKKTLKVFLMLLIPVISHANDPLIENLPGKYKANVSSLLFCGLGSLYKFGSLEITYEKDKVIFYYQDFWHELIASFSLDTLKESVAKKEVLEGSTISKKIITLEKTVSTPCTEVTWKYNLEFLNNKLIAARLLERRDIFIDEEDIQYVKIYNIEEI